MFKGSGAAKALADQIRIAAYDVSGRLRSQTCNARKTEVSSDDMSEAMMPFLKEVGELREFPDSTAVAFDLVMRLGRCSYGEIDCDGCGCGDRPSDQDVDDLLVEFATERRKIEPSWEFFQVLGALQRQAKYLSDYGIKGLCAQTIMLLSAW